MTYLQRINYRPTTEGLTDKEHEYLLQHFDAYGADIVVNGDAIPWERVEAVEVVVAARAGGLSGWMVKNLIMQGERYHVGVYFGREEAVLTNVTLPVARYVVQNIAYYAPRAVEYTGPEDLSPLTEI